MSSGRAETPKMGAGPLEPHTTDLLMAWVYPPIAKKTITDRTETVHNTTATPITEGVAHLSVKLWIPFMPSLLPSPLITRWATFRPRPLLWGSAANINSQRPPTQRAPLWIASAKPHPLTRPWARVYQASWTPTDIRAGTKCLPRY